MVIPAGLLQIVGTDIEGIKSAGDAKDGRFIQRFIHDGHILFEGNNSLRLAYLSRTWPLRRATSFHVRRNVTSVLLSVLNPLS